MRRSGVLMASAVLGAALVASEPAVAFRGGGGSRSVAVDGFNRGGWGR